MKTIYSLLFFGLGYFNLTQAQVAPVLASIQGPNNVCAQPAIASTFTANASNSPSIYFWSYSGQSGAVISNSNSSVATISFPNGVSGTTYTLSCYAMNGFGASNTVNYIVTVFETPVVSFSGSNIFCQGSSTNLSASSTIYSSSSTLSYSWSPSFGLNTTTGANVNANPSSPTNYTVVASIGSCTNSSQFSVQGATVVVSPLSQSVCLGSSATFIASGAATYTWSNSTTSASLNVSPNSTSTYTISGTSSNGCMGVSIVTLNVNANCADVWPGDANRDGVVTTSDVLELGLSASSTGAARNITGNTWTSHYANAWSGNGSTGWNKAHTDCNGDGVVNNLDTAAIYTNFSLSHSFKESAVASSNPDINLVSQTPLAFIGVWNVADIILGDSTNIQNQIYGTDFEINYDQNVIETDSIKIMYTSSFLNANNQNINFVKPYFSNGKLYCASVRADHSNVTGEGKIGEFWYKLKSDLTENSSVSISVSNANKINSFGLITNSTNGNGTTLSVTADLVGLQTNEHVLSNIYVFPNPAKDYVTLKRDNQSLTSYTITDISGRVLFQNEFVGKTDLNLSAYQKGIYFIQFDSATNSITKKIVIE